MGKNYVTKGAEMIYIVNGAPGCGKTTFERMCVEMVRFHAVSIVSTIDFVKDVAKFCGWKGEKTPENRKFLSQLKHLLTEWDNIPYKRTIFEIEKEKENFIENDFHENEYAIFVDCREPEEITKLKVALGAKAILIRRDEAENKIASNASDAGVLNYDGYDIAITNNESLEELRNTVRSFLETEGLPLSKQKEKTSN